MRTKQRGVFSPRSIDRTVFAILATVHVAYGAYLAGPWYLDVWADSEKAPLVNLLNSDQAVSTYGAVLFVNGLFLFYSAASTATSRFYSAITSGTLLSGFLVALYSLIGILLVTESWRPPTYLFHFLGVAVLGAYWVWVKFNVRTI